MLSEFRTTANTLTQSADLTAALVDAETNLIRIRTWWDVFNTALADQAPHGQFDQVAIDVSLAELNTARSILDGQLAAIDTLALT